MLLNLRSISKMFGPTIVLDAISFVVNRGDRIGLVGANGAGKSTLLKIAIGDLEPDSGAATFAPGATWGYVAQQLEALPGSTVEAVLWDAQSQLRALQAQIDAVAATMAHAVGADLERAMAEYGGLAEQFDQRGGYEMDHRIDYVLDGLGLGRLPRDQPVERLSGGEKTRLGLAALLLSAPDLLLLDEPTNHLDFAASAWLEEYLREQRGAVLAVSHDRQFLNRIATGIVEIDEHSHQARAYVGDYDAYLAAKRAERRRWQEDYERQQDEIKRLQQRIKAQYQSSSVPRAPSDGDKLSFNFFGERATSAAARNIRAAEQALLRIQADPIPEPPQPLVFRPNFDPAKSESARALIVEHVSHRFGDRLILDDLSFELYPATRVLILGPNGAGKTTLLNLLAGIAPPQSGRITRGPKITVGYLRQEFARREPSQTLFDLYRDGMVGFPKDVMNELLAWGLFTYEETTRLVGDVSVGQYHKLQIARLMASRANLLLLDEPTNHVSFDVLDQFETALQAFPGPVVAVSHDRWFIDRFRGELWLLYNGRLITDRDRVLALMDEQ